MESVIQDSMPDRCNCQKSQCLKQYCECFSQGRKCNPLTCLCYQCLNLEEHLTTNEEAKRAIKKRKTVTSSVSDRQKRQQFNGCTCKRSKCVRGYCDCFKLNVRCTSKCKCLECHNKSDMSIESIISASLTVPSNDDKVPLTDSLIDAANYAVSKASKKRKKSKAVKSLLMRSLSMPMSATQDSMTTESFSVPSDEITKNSPKLHRRKIRHSFLRMLKKKWGIRKSKRPEYFPFRFDEQVRQGITDCIISEAIVTPQDEASVFCRMLGSFNECVLLVLDDNLTNFPSAVGKNVVS